MGSKVDKGLKLFATGGASLIDDSGAFSTGKSAGLRAQKRQESAIAAQAKDEKLRLAQATSDVATRKAGAGRAKRGRGSLIATSQTGLSSTLGGSNGAA